MVFIALAVLGWIPSVLGYGALLRYAGSPLLRRAVSGMLGLGVLATIGTLLHFATPLSPFVSGCVWAGGVAVFVWRRRWLAAGISTAEIVAAALGLLVFVFLTQPPWRLYDAGLYYLQAVRWTTDYPLQIGLVNLHSRLAYNSAWFVVSAVLEHPFATRGSAWIVNILPMVFATAAAGVGFGRIVQGERSFPNVALAMLLLPIAHSAEGLGAHALDQALTVMIPLVLVLWARALQSDDEFRGEGPAAALLSVFVVMIKVSAAPLAIGAVVALALMLRRGALPVRTAVKIGATGGVAVAAWCARSVLLSGCLVYPVVSSCITGLRWAQEREAVEREVRWIYSWARQPNATPEVVLASWDWLTRWVWSTLNRYDYLILFMLIVVGLIAAAVNARRAARVPFALPYAIAVGGTGFWFLTAPDPRFALGFLFSLAILPIALGLSGLSLAPVGRWAVVLTIVLAGAYMTKATGVLRLALRRPWPVAVVGWPPLPITNVVTRATASGYFVDIPVKGDQCWANPPPCTPSFDPALARDWALVNERELEGATRPVTIETAH